jgi:hypothetical protein
MGILVFLPSAASSHHTYPEVGRLGFDLDDCQIHLGLGHLRVLVHLGMVRGKSGSDEMVEDEATVGSVACEVGTYRTSRTMPRCQILTIGAKCGGTRICPQSMDRAPNMRVMRWNGVRVLSSARSM